MDQILTKSLNVWNPISDEVCPTPIRELIPCMISVFRKETQDVVWVELGELMADLDLKRCLTPQELKNLVLGLKRILDEVYLRPFEKWNAFFRASMNPAKEIQKWVLLAFCYSNFIKGKSLRKDQNDDYLRLFLFCKNGDSDADVNAIDFKCITNDEKKNAINAYKTCVQNQPSKILEFFNQLTSGRALLEDI